MGAGNGRAFPLHLLDSRSDRTISRSPAEHQNFSTRFAKDFHRRNVSDCAIDFLLSEFDHQMMIFRIVVNVAGDVLFLDAADAMFESGRSRKSVGPSQRRLVARV